jgi:hypothetical protein
MKFSFRLGVEPGGEWEGVDEREGAGQQQELRPAGVHRQVPHVPRIRPHQVLRSSVPDLINLMQILIRILLVTVMRIRILLFTLMWIRIRVRIPASK